MKIKSNKSFTNFKNHLVTDFRSYKYGILTANLFSLAIISTEHRDIKFLWLLGSRASGPVGHRATSTGVSYLSLIHI